MNLFEAMGRSGQPEGAITNLANFAQNMRTQKLSEAKFLQDTELHKQQLVKNQAEIGVANLQLEEAQKQKANLDRVVPLDVLFGSLDGIKDSPRTQDFLTKLAGTQIVDTNVPNEKGITLRDAQGVMGIIKEKPELQKAMDQFALLDYSEQKSTLNKAIQSPGVKPEQQQAFTQRLNQINSSIGDIMTRKNEFDQYDKKKALDLQLQQAQINHTNAATGQAQASTGLDVARTNLLNNPGTVQGKTALERGYNTYAQTEIANGNEPKPIDEWKNTSWNPAKEKTLTENQVKQSFTDALDGDQNRVSLFWDDYRRKVNSGVKPNDAVNETFQAIQRFKGSTMPKTSATLAPSHSPTGTVPDYNSLW